MNGGKGLEQLVNIPMSDESKNEWVNNLLDKFDKMLDKCKHSGPSETRLINLEDKNMRILKGYNKDEQKELEDTKRKYMNGGDLLQIIVGVPLDAECGFIWRKYDRAEKDEQISIIKDILDFYTDKAKFPEQKYYVQLIKNNDGSYLNRNKLNNSQFLTLDGCYTNYQTEFTEQEIKDIDPRYMAFAVPVEEI